MNKSPENSPANKAEAASKAEPKPQNPGVSAPREVAIVGGNRIPFARAYTAYADVSEKDMMLAALDGLVARFGLQGERLGAVAAGAVLKHPKDFNLTREVVLGSQLDPATPAHDVQMACATGVEAVGSVADKIAHGRIDVGVAGGVDSISDAPVVVTDGLRKILVRLTTAKTVKQKLAAIASIRPSHLKPVAPGTAEPRTGLSMGEHQAITNERWGITREAQDELAAASHRNLAKAYDENFFDDLITGFQGLTRDNNMRPDSTVEKLAKLKTVYGKNLKSEPTMTAGNSTPLTDGASAVLLSSVEYADEKGLPKLAKLVDYELGAVDFVGGEEGLLMAPAYAVPRMLERNGLTLQDFDFYEIHEAFAGTVLSTLKAWEDEEFCTTKLGLKAPLGSIDRSKLNVNGSSLAAGHPFAATGGRIIASAAKMVHAKGNKARALVSVCAAGGQGAVAIVEAF